MDWDDENWKDEEAEPENEAEDDATVPCPFCHRPIFEDAERCPYCEQYISDEDRSANRKPWWVLLGVLLCFAAMGLWFLMGG